MDAADIELFERSIRGAVESQTGPALDAALADLGWGDALEDDAQVAVSLLFELQGSNNVSSASLGRVIARGLGIEHEGPGVVLPSLDRWAPPGEIDGGRLTLAGLATTTPSEQAEALVVARSDGKDVAVVVPAESFTLRTIEGIDPWLGLVEVTSESIAVEAEPAPVAEWSAAIALGQVAVAHELVGAASTVLELARVHALERVQFGRPIAQFQAVRHRLADTLIAIETARAVVDAAWLDGSPETAAMAKALAGRGARTAARHGQQVMAGIGFTTEHDLHRYIRRILVLDELLGSSRTLTGEQGETLLASRQLPPLLPL